MAPPLKDRKFGTLALIVLFGVIAGAYFGIFLEAILPPGVVKTFFTHAISFGFGDMGSPKPIDINFAAIRFQFGIQFKFSLMSVLGVFMSLYFFRWYK